MLSASSFVALAKPLRCSSYVAAEWQYKDAPLPSPAAGIPPCDGVRQSHPTSSANTFAARCRIVMLPTPSAFTIASTRHGDPYNEKLRGGGNQGASVPSAAANFVAVGLLVSARGLSSTWEPSQYKAYRLERGLSTLCGLQVEAAKKTGVVCCPLFLRS